MIVFMNREQAEYVLGQSPSHPGRALEPAPLKTGEYVLPPEVLADPANADIYDYLLAMPQRAPIPPEDQFDFGTAEKPNQPDIDAYNAARLTWSEGTIRGTGAPAPEMAASTVPAQAGIKSGHKRISGKKR